MIQYAEEPDPKYRHASVDLFVAPAHHRQGVATEAIGLVVEHLIGGCGHHRITIDPAAANTAAIGCYAKARLPPGRAHAPGGAGRRRRGVARRAADGAGGGGLNASIAALNVGLGRMTAVALSRSTR